MTTSSNASQTRSNRSDKIFKSLEERILAWHYLPGQRLKEDELCHEFGVSRIPVREALSRLSQIHLVERKPNSGCTVKQWSLEEINDLYELRIVLESHVCEDLARRGVAISTFADLKQEWQQHLDQCRKGDFAPEDWAARDEAFHESLARAHGNKQLQSTLRDINARLRFLRRKDITTLRMLEISSKQHLAIIRAIKAGKPEQAKAKIIENIQTGQGNVKNALKEVLMQAFEVA